MAKILGLDVADSTIGVAVSDPLGWTAQGLTTIHRNTVKGDLTLLKKVIKENNVKEIVVGLPFKKDGSIDAQTRKILRFARLLRTTLHMPVRTWDERFTTVAANKVLDQGHVKRKKKLDLIDKIAAIIILQGYLDNRNENPPHAHGSFRTSCERR